METENFIWILIIIGIFIMFYAMIDSGSKQKKELDTYAKKLSECFDKYGNLIDEEKYNNLQKDWTKKTKLNNNDPDYHKDFTGEY